MKTCTKCGQEKSEEEFGLETKRGKPFRRADCRACRNASRTARRVVAPENSERSRARVKQWKKNNPDKWEAQRDKYERDNPEKVAERNKKQCYRYRKKSPEKVREYKRQHYLAADSGQRREKRKNKYRLNADRAKCQTRTWRRRNRNKVRVYKARSRALRISRIANTDDGTVTEEFLASLYAKTRCHYCQGYVNKRRRQADHQIPLSRGGPHSASNLVMACKKCNLSKGAKTHLEFS